MIAYDILVQTIADWRAGVRPTAPSLPPIPTGAPEMVEEYDSGLVDIDDGQYAVEGEAAQYAAAEGEYAEGEYAEGEYSQAQPVDAVDQTYQDDDEEQY